MGPRTSPDSNYPVCSVCGNGGARYHYHGLVCQSCRVFFIRTVGQNKPLVCNRGGDCATLLGNSCNACAACRFKKCLEAKMDCSAVGRKRKPNPCVNIIPSRNRAWKEQLQETLQPQAAHWFNNIPGIGNVVDLALQLVKMEIDVNTLDNPTTSTDELDAYGITATCKLGSNAGSCLKQKHPSTYCFRNASIYMESLRFCPEIKALDTSDKSTLVESNYQEFGLFSHKYYAWLAKKNCASAFMAVNQSCQLKAESIEEIFETCQVSDCEFVLLKIIALLSPAQTLSQDGHWYVVLARTRFISLLTDFSKKQYPELTTDQQSLRIAKMVQAIAKVKEETTYQSRNLSSSDVSRLTQTMRLSPTYSKYISL